MNAKKITRLRSEFQTVLPQMCLALRYLHKEKRIVHRDLTPSNIMLGEKDKVTISESELFWLYLAITIHLTPPVLFC